MFGSLCLIDAIRASPHPRLDDVAGRVDYATDLKYYLWSELLNGLPKRDPVKVELLVRELHLQPNVALHQLADGVVAKLAAQAP